MKYERKEGVCRFDTLQESTASIPPERSAGVAIAWHSSADRSTPRHNLSLHIILVNGDCTVLSTADMGLIMGWCVYANCIMTHLLTYEENDTVYQRFWVIFTE